MGQGNIAGETDESTGTQQLAASRPSSTSATRLIIETAADYRTALIGIADRNVKERGDLNRDYATAGLAIAGASITILTIAPTLPKTLPMFYVGTFFVLVSIVTAFLSRHQLLQYLQNVMFAEERKYGAVTDAARAAEFRPEDLQASAKLNFVINNQNDPAPSMKWLADKGYKLVGWLLLAGASLVAVSLVFRVGF